jgi:hypothetical protein
VLPIRSVEFVFLFFNFYCLIRKIIRTSLAKIISAKDNGYSQISSLNYLELFAGENRPETSKAFWARFYFSDIILVSFSLD